MKTLATIRKEAQMYIDGDIAKKGSGYLLKPEPDWSITKIYKDHMGRPVIYPSIEKAMKETKKWSMRNLKYAYKLEGAVMSSPAFPGAKLIIPTKILNVTQVKQ